MKKFNILIATSVVALLATGCVKPVQDSQPIYDATTTSNTTTSNTTPTTTTTTQGIIYEEASPIIYEEASPIVYEPAGSTGIIYEEVREDGTVITTGSTSGQAVTGTGGVTYPDPYANGGTGTIYNDTTYSSQPAISDYPATSSVSSSVSSGAQGGGIQLQIAALKEYATAEDYKNRLSLAPGLSAYVQRGRMNKVIVTGIPSISEANRLKETRFPGAFIVHGATSGGYTPTVQPNYSTTTGGGGAYSVNSPYGTSSSSSGSSSGIGVQVGAFGSQGKAQSVANSQSAKYPATVKKIGQYYKVILTGFSSRSAAKAHAGRVGGFVVNY